MPQVELTDKEWQMVIRVLSQAPWAIANPLLVRIATQLKTRTPMMNEAGLTDEDLFTPPGYVEKQHS